MQGRQVEQGRSFGVVFEPGEQFFPTLGGIAKGLEFDTVIVTHVDGANYANEMDRCMLYIACTRAMHERHLTHAGRVAGLLEFATGHGDVTTDAVSASS